MFKFNFLKQGKKVSQTAFVEAASPEAAYKSLLHSRGIDTKRYHALRKEGSNIEVVSKRTFRNKEMPTEHGHKIEGEYLISVHGKPIKSKVDKIAGDIVIKQPKTLMNRVKGEVERVQQGEVPIKGGRDITDTPYHGGEPGARDFGYKPKSNDRNEGLLPAKPHKGVVAKQPNRKKDKGKDPGHASNFPATKDKPPKEDD